MNVDNITSFIRGADAEDIYVDKVWRPKVGQPMPHMDGYFIGKKFGAGALSMNSIYDLVDRDGNSLGQALKVCKQSLSARRSLAHEWKMFKNLGVLGEDQPAARSHFLQAYRVLKLPNQTIVGIVMEKANGQNVSKTLNDPNFCNIRYVIALMRDVLVGLDVAQRVLGFAHYDLKLDNVMEHWSCNSDPDTSKSRVLFDAVPQFKLFDFGTAVVYGDPFAVKSVPNKRFNKQLRPQAADELKHEKKHGDSDKPGVVAHSADTDEYEYSEPYCCVRIYHIWGKAKGDVYRVLLALCKLLDDRIWPLEDLELVSLCFTVLEHATNSRRIRAKFMPKAALWRKLGMSASSHQHKHHQNSNRDQITALPQQRKENVTTGTTKLAPVVVAAADRQHALSPASPSAATGGYSPVRRIAADAPRTSLDAQQGNRSSIGSVAAANRQSGGAVGAISDMVTGAASGGTVSSAGTAAPGLQDGVEALPGVAYTRLAPVSSSTPAVAPDSTSVPLHRTSPFDQSQQSAQQPVAAAPARSVNLDAYRSTSLTPVEERHYPPLASLTPVKETDAADGRKTDDKPHFDINAPDEGCLLDPAAHVVRHMPVAPAAHQSVLGSRKALKGVTAQQLLLEPIVQSLLSKI